jgi:hypothetical protein
MVLYPGGNDPIARANRNERTGVADGQYDPEDTPVFVHKIDPGEIKWMTAPTALSG